MSIIPISKCDMPPHNLVAVLLCWVVFLSATAEPRLPTDVNKWTYPGHDPVPNGGRFWDRRLLRSAVGTVDFDTLARVVKKLNSGQGIVVMAVGSSVTCYGGNFEGRPGMLSSIVPTPEYERRRGTSGWLNNLMQVIQKAWPHPDHVLYNAGLWASSFLTRATSSCMEAMLPNVTVDLVIAEIIPHMSMEEDEFADGNHELGTIALEHFMRRIASHYTALHLSTPSFIFLKPITFSYNTSEFWYCPSSMCPAARCSDYQGPFSQPNRNVTFEWRGEERVLGIAKYYGQAAVSLRYMFYAAKLKNAWLGSVSDCQLAQRLYGDDIHPTGLGHVLYADLLVNLIADTEAYLLAQPSGQEQDTTHAAAPPYSLPLAALTAKGQQIFQMRCYGELPLRAPKPALPEAGDPHQSHLYALVPLAHEGWQHMETQQAHTKHPGEPPKYKPGWSSTTVGSVFKFQINSAFVVQSTVTPNATVTITYLASYEHMGSASFSCVEQCTCEAVTVDAHHKEHVSISVVKDVPNVTPHEACVMAVTILPGSTSPNGEHKFKVVSVMVAVPVHHL